MRGARQQQVGDIRTRNEQHERDGPHQRPEDCFDPSTEDTVQKWVHRRRDVLIGVLVLLGKLSREVRHLAAGLLDRDSVGETAVHDITAALAPTRPQ